MNTSEGGRKRRRHSAEFKAKVVSASRQPGVSMAAVALAHGLNANLLRRWVVEAGHSPQRALPGASPTLTDTTTLPAFVALPLPTPSSASPVAPADPIRIELTRGTTAIRVQWPLSAAAQCAAWLRELL
ncbi:MAG: transposase [Burkholderiaceae bacterium]|nr:transposase [Burkholderiaceae bacterium]